MATKDFVAKAAGSGAAGSGVNLTAAAELKSYSNGKIFDITRNNVYGPDANDWFESRMAEPDLFLMDLAAAITCVGGGRTVSLHLRRVM